MRLGWLAAGAALGLAACAESVGPRAGSVILTIIPVFNAEDPYAAQASSADSLRIFVVRRDSAGVFRDTVERVTVAIDPVTGEAAATLTLELVRSPQQFQVILQAVRSSDGVIVFSGENVVQVTSQSGSGSDQQVQIPVTYTGPRAKRIVLAPRDTGLTGTTPFTYRVTAYDSLDNVLTGVETRFFLVNPADSTKLRLNRLNGVASAVASATGAVGVYARTVDSAAHDTTRVFVGSVPTGVRITPGYATLAVGDTLTFAGQIVDIAGNPLAGSVSWASRSVGVATVDAASGKATAGAPGTAVLVASGGGGSDSVLVTVAPATDAIVSTTSSGQAFRKARVGDTVVVDVTADMRFTPDEKLGSYNATLVWNGGLLQFLGVQSGDFASPTVNTSEASSGQLRFSAADPNGASGAVALTRVRFRAVAAGTTSLALTITEMSAAGTFTNLYATNRVSVTDGSVTVRP